MSKSINKNKIKEYAQLKAKAKRARNFALGKDAMLWAYWHKRYKACVRQLAYYREQYRKLKEESDVLFSAFEGWQYIDQNGTLFVASLVYGYPYESELDSEGHTSLKYQEDYYTISAHQGLMPAFHTERHDSAEEFIAAMRKIAPLSSWRELDQEN